MQKEILEKNPEGNVRVYAIWFSMLPTDARRMWRWGGNTLSDSRVTHFWDEQKLVGRWFGKNINQDEASGGVVWDAYYLYPAGAEWTSKPPDAIGSGGTVREKVDELNQKMASLLTTPASR